MDFRTLAKKGFWIRAIDVAGHVAIGLALGSWWQQFWPDTFIPLIFLRSYWSNELLPEDSWLIQMHRFYHTVWPSAFLFGWWLVGRDKVAIALSVQWLLHVIWDQVTHPEPEFQKSLWSVNV